MHDGGEVDRDRAPAPGSPTPRPSPAGFFSIMYRSHFRIVSTATSISGVIRAATKQMRSRYVTEEMIGKTAGRSSRHAMTCADID
jgi:hypothetical protein